MEEERWRECIDRAALCLSRACERASEAMDEGKMGVKEIRELTVALKDLTLLRRSLDGEDEAASADTAVEVSFDEESEEWSR